MALVLPWHPDVLHHSISGAVHSFPAWAVLHMAGVAAAVLSLIGALGVASVHEGRLGRLGQAAVLVIAAGMLGTTALFAVEAVAFPLLAEHAPQLLTLDGPLSRSWLLIGIALLAVCWPLGLMLLGIAAARARVFPLRAGLLLSATGAAFLAFAGPFVPVLGPLAGVAFGASQVYLGLLLRRAVADGDQEG